MPQAKEEEVAPGELVVLVVDDNIDAAMSLGCLLELLGCETAVAYDGPTAIQVAAVAHPHLAIIDLDLPGFDGCEVIRRLRANGWIGPGARICLTGRGGPEDRTRCTEAGFDEFWSKPLELSDLHRALASSREAVRGRLEQQQGRGLGVKLQ
ncbi:response regulator [Eleftheria terrae]|uniref:response regulator n=1 Tax=Eleftheria terrae TaxID=1597781 RepID=UPI00263B107A|nr:response regulator [Eleftheria terrae]WKB50725.1 response regulator [Eleftheria terrae]